MKTAARVFIWIGMILGCYLIFPVIVGMNALNKLDTAKTKDELTTAAWLTFWFCNMIGGIFMLNINDFDEHTTNTSNKKTFDDIDVEVLAELIALEEILESIDNEKTNESDTDIVKEKKEN